MTAKQIEDAIIEWFEGNGTSGDYFRVDDEDRTDATIDGHYDLSALARALEKKMTRRRGRRGRMVG